MNMKEAEQTSTVRFNFLAPTKTQNAQRKSGFVTIVS